MESWEMRGYFAIGAEGLSKPLNAGNLFRSAHAFGASFIFTVGGSYKTARSGGDTSHAPTRVPLYEYESAADLALPGGCRLVGIELLDNAVELPSFKHPPQAAYILGPERGNLSPEIVAQCDNVVKIPTAFCINVAMAGAIVMYDRTIAMGRFPARAVSSIATPEELPPHIHGKQKFRTKKI
jgi:tRNA G18 (ribose-2'-O)-methylase SpoU